MRTGCEHETRHTYWGVAPQCCFTTWDSGAQEVEELSVLGVHDGSFYKLHHRVTTILKLGMTPQTERSCTRTRNRCKYTHNKTAAVKCVTHHLTGINTIYIHGSEFSAHFILQILINTLIIMGKHCPTSKPGQCLQNTTGSSSTDPEVQV